MGSGSAAGPGTPPILLLDKALLTQPMLGPRIGCPPRVKQLRIIYEINNKSNFSAAK